MKSTIFLALLALAITPAWAQDDEIVQPDVEALAVVWEFTAEPAQVHEALLKVLADEEMALDPESGADAIVTEFVQFRAEQFGAENVAEEAPVLTEQYLFLQPRKVQQGRMRLRARIEASGSGTQVHVELDLLVRSFHALARGGLAEAVRRSNGSIESFLQERLQATLAEAVAAAEKENP